MYFNALYVSGCLGETRIYNLYEKKLAQEQSVNFLLVIQKNLRGIDFIVLTIILEFLKL